MNTKAKQTFEKLDSLEDVADKLVLTISEIRADLKEILDQETSKDVASDPCLETVSEDNSETDSTDSVIVEEDFSEDESEGIDPSEDRSHYENLENKVDETDQPTDRVHSYE